MRRDWQRRKNDMDTRAWIAASAVLVLGAAVPAGNAGEVPEAVGNAVRSLVGPVEPGAIRTSPVPGFYEARAQGEILYVSADGRYLFHGNLYAVAERRNLTEDARREVRRDLVGRMDEDALIVFAPAGATKHRLTVFTDVDCPYCAKFHLEVPDLNASGVEVRYAAWPRTPPWHGEPRSLHFRLVRPRPAPGDDRCQGRAEDRARHLREPGAGALRAREAARRRRHPHPVHRGRYEHRRLHALASARGAARAGLAQAMRVIIFILGVIAVLVWLGVELRGRMRDLSMLCFGLAAIFAVLLVGAFFGIYGA